VLCGVVEAAPAWGGLRRGRGRGGRAPGQVVAGDGAGGHGGEDTDEQGGQGDDAAAQPAQAGDGGVAGAGGEGAHADEDFTVEAKIP
jgi:hypothetical protein